MDVNYKGGAPGFKLETFSDKASQTTQKISKAINDKCTLELSKPISTTTKVTTSSLEKSAQKEHLPKEKVTRGGLVIAVKTGLGEVRQTSSPAQTQQISKVPIPSLKPSVKTARSLVPPKREAPPMSSLFSNAGQNTALNSMPAVTHQSLESENDKKNRLSITAQIIHLDSALKTSKKEKNNSALKIAIHQSEEVVKSIIQSNPEPNSRLTNLIAAYQTKLAECKEQKSILLSKNKLDVVNTIIRDTGAINKTQAAKIAEEVRLVTKKDAHAFQINGVTYVVSKKLPDQENTKAIPAIWKRESKHFAEGTYGFIYGGKYIGTTGAGRLDVMKEAKTYPEEPHPLVRSKRIERAKDELFREVEIANEIHGNGRKEGVVPPPHTVLYRGKAGYLVDRQQMDGFDLGLNMIDTIMPNVEINRIMEKATKGLDAIHEKGYYHGDIKPENLLWNGNTLLVGDLGGARKFTDLVPHHQYPQMQEFVHTHTSGYLSEEVFYKITHVLEKNEKNYNKEQDPIKKEAFLIKLIENEIAPLLKQNDRFALGMTLYICLIGKMPPFYKAQAESSSSSESSESVFSTVSSKDMEKIYKEIAHFSSASQNIIASYLTAPYRELLA